MNNALLGLAGLLIAVLAALFAVPYFIDWNGYRGMFEDEASRVLGRDVRVGGSVDVRLLPVPYVSFAKVRVADTANDTGDPFFRADSFTMWLSIQPLLRGQLEARRVELTRPVLRLVVDPQGSGNWSTIKAQPGALPFVPSNVALQSVRLRDGLISVVRGQGGVNRGTLAELSGIDGELEAETLDGPYRFKGNALWQDEAREVRVATSKVEDDGSVRLKASVRVPATANTYTLEGRVSDLRQRPRLDGELAGRIGLDVAARDGKAKARGGEQPQLDGKGRIEADGTGMRLREIAATLENVGQPQLISGEAQMAWVGKPAMEARLSSRLLDLDRIAGAQAATPALDVTRGMVAAVVGLLPAEADATVGLDVDQATLGGDSVSAVSVVLQRLGGQLDLKQMRAGVPGGGRIDVSGRIALKGPAADAKASETKPGETKPGESKPGDGAAGKVADASGGQPMALDGNVVLRGSSLARFLAWAAPKAAASSRPDSPFLVAGRLIASDAAIEIADATAEIGATPLAGGARLEFGERRRVMVRLDGRQINLGQLWPEAFAGGADTGLVEALLPGLAARLGLPPAAPRPAPAKDAGKDAAKDAAKAGGAAPGGLVDLTRTDVQARITAGELLLGADTLTDVDADIAIDRGALAINALRGTTAAKLGFDVTGQLADAGANAKGVLRWSAVAPSAEAAGELTRLIGAAADPAAGTTRFGALAPVRLAGTLALGQRGERSTDLTVDGALGGGRLVSRIKSDADPAGWRAAHLDASTRFDGDDTLGLLRSVLPGLVAMPERGEVPRRGQLFLKAVGIADKGLATLATLDGDGLKLAYDGRWQVTGDGRNALDGTWTATSPDARAVLSLIGLPAGGALSSVALDGRGTIAAGGGDTTLATRRLALGASTVSGRVALKRAEGKPVHFEADVAADKASVAGLLAALAQSPPANVAAEGGAGVPAAALGGGETWPSQPLDTRVIDGLDGRLTARIERLSVEPGMALADAAMELGFTPGRIDIARLEGVGMGGKIAVKGQIEKAAGGVKLTGRLETDGVNLVALGAPEREPAASGPVKLTLDATGQGGSAATVIGSLSGRGDIVVGPAEIAGFVPSPLAALGTAAIEGKGERSGEGLAKAVREAMAQGRFKIAATTIPVEVLDGTLKTKPLVIESDNGRTTLSVVVELASLRFDAGWQVEARLPKPAEGKPEKGPLPPVVIAYVGRLKDLGKVEPRYDLAPFEREVEVRKMEHDVEELERLRKLDEERARAEAERQKALEEERQRAAEAEKARAAAAAAMSGAVEARPEASPAAGAGQPAATGQPTAPAADAKPGAAAPGSQSGDAKPAAGKPGDWQTVEKPADPPPAPEAVAPQPKPRPAPAPAQRPRPKQLTPGDVFKPF